MRVFSLTVTSVACAAGLLWSSVAQADWRELVKEETGDYYFDQASVMSIHVSRLAWTLADLPHAGKTASGATYQSVMVRWRLYCRNDTIIQLAVSYFEKPMGKGKEVEKEDFLEWRSREMAIRPSTYLAALKNEVCSARSVAG